MKDEPTSANTTGRDEPLAGLRLAEARRARKLSLTEIANELHLDPQKVTALEQNRFAELGAPVFVKGYLRKYAGILGISPDPVLADYQRLTQGADEPPVVASPRRPAPEREFPVGTWLTVLLLLGAAGLGLWLWQSGRLERVLPGWIPVELPAVAGREEPARDVPAGAQVPDPVPAGAGAAAAAPETAAAVEALPQEPPGTTEPAPEAAEEPVLAAPENVPPPEGQVALTLSFADDCWTEVSDAAGDRLFFGIGRAGESVSVTGREPLRVLLGNYPAVTLTVDGRPYAIPASARRGQTARLAIGEASP